MSAVTNPWARWRVRLGYPAAIAFALLAHPTPLSLVVGATIAALGLLIRGAAAGHLYKHQRLSTSGPYRYTRNPLYFGSALLAAGLLVAGRSPYAAAVIAFYFEVFYPQVMQRESEELHARYGSHFDEYAARVPFFFPSLFPRTGPGAPFSWAQYRINREYQAALGFLLGLALLYAKMILAP